MPVWAWIAIGVAVVALVCVGVVLGIYVWKRVTRRYLLQLVSRREAVIAARNALAEVVSHLAEASDDGLARFAEDAETVDRKVLVELHRRAEILSEELGTMALPKKLICAAEALADASLAVGVEAGRVGEHSTPTQVLDALAAIDMSRVNAAFEAANTEFHAACEVCRIDEDSAVYGGGLYI